MTPPTEVDVKPSLASLAMKALAESDYDRKQAAQLLHGWLDEDSDLRHVLMDPLVKSAIEESVRAAVSQNNQSLRVRRENADDVSSIRASAWYTYILPNGVTLGNAKHADLEAAAVKHEGDAKANVRKAKWLRAIDSKIADRRVSDAIAETAIAKLWEASR